MANVRRDLRRTAGRGICTYEAPSARLRRGPIGGMPHCGGPISSPADPTADKLAASASTGRRGPVTHNRVASVATHQGSDKEAGCVSLRSSQDGSAVLIGDGSTAARGGDPAD